MASKNTRSTTQPARSAGPASGRPSGRSSRAAATVQGAAPVRKPSRGAGGKSSTAAPAGSHAPDRPQTDGASARSLLDSLADGALVLSEQGVVLHANPAAERFLGRSPAALLGTTPDLPRLPDADALLDLPGREGAHRSARATVRRAAWEGEPTLLVLLHDAAPGTAEPEPQQQATRERLRSIVEYSVLGICALDTSGCVSFLNGRMARLLRLEPAAVLGRPLLDFIHASDRAGLEQHFRTCMGGEALHCELRMVRSGGTPVWCSLALTPWCDDEVFRGATVAVSDITEQKIAEELDGESIRFQQHMLDSISDIAWAVDREGRFIAVNEPFVHAWRLEGEDLVGRTAQSVWGEDLAQVFLDHDQEVLSTGQRKVAEEVVVNGDRTAWVETVRTPLRAADGALLGLVAVARDVTERKKAVDRLLYTRHELETRVRQRTHDLEEANELLRREIAQRKRTEAKLKRARREAEEATKAKSDFLASMSHEIRTPLNAILGLTDLTLHGFGTVDPRPYLERIKEAGTGLNTVINDILDHSKIEASRLETDETVFSIRDVLREAAAMHSFQAERKGLEMTVEAAPDVPLRLHGDALSCRQILQNLLANAVKFTAEGSVRVTAALAADQPAPAAPGDTAHLEITVADTGIGIPEASREIIFESFKQADDSISRRYGGTGLGLAICRYLAGQLGGAISVTSTVGRGSAFLVELPFRTVADDAACPTPSFGLGGGLIGDLGGDAWLKAPSLEPLEILLVEDSALNRDLATIFLSGRGHTVTSAENGLEALEILKTRSFDLILMDIQMPEMDGVTATAHIRSDAALACPRDIPVVALTAHALKGDRARFMEAGMDEYVSKPIDFAVLVQAMCRLLPGKVLAAASCAEGPPIGAPRIEPPRGGAGRAADADEDEVPRDASLREHRDKALALIGGNRDLLGKLDAVFITDTPADLTEITRALNRDDLTTAARLAHKVKGAAATLGLEPVRLAALALEGACTTADEDRHARLHALKARVREALRFLGDY
ncbi:MAG: PAS domain-containing protein [Desulfovibrionaceae bacterium]|jgi:PAS domain S-box-containing protein|nr:PAS domain-containing protein [Desulfovibrionaceae bacterium]